MFDEQRPDEIKLSPELAALETQLRALSPAMPQIDRDRLMFAAGRSAVSRPRWPGYIAGPSWAGSWLWPASAALMTAATLLLATMLVWQHRSSQPIAANANSTSASSNLPSKDVGLTSANSALPPTLTWNSVPPNTSGYLAMRYIALTRGVGALSPDFPTSTVGRDSSTDKHSAEPATARNLLDELLPSFTRSNQSRS
jgi:hypothetical protein